MKSCTPALATYLQNLILGSVGAQFWIADLYSFTLLNAQSFYYTSWDQPVKITPWGLSGGPFTFLPLDPVNNGPGITRSKYRSTLGLEVATVDVEMIAPPTTQVTNATPILQAFAAGMMDGATVRIDRLITPPPGVSGQGTFNLFLGTVGPAPEIGRSHVKFTIRSITEQFNILYPKRLYQTECLHVLFDQGCTLSAAAFQQSGKVVGSGSTTIQINTNLTQPGPQGPPSSAPSLSYSSVHNTNLITTTYYVVVTYITAMGESAPSPEAVLQVPFNNVLVVQSPPSGSGILGWNVYVGKGSGDEQLQNDSPIAIGTPWQESNDGLVLGLPYPQVGSGALWDQGVITFTSGANNTESRFVPQYLGGGVLKIEHLLPFAPAAGDTFTILPGCDKSMVRCQQVFNNLLHFLGFPFVPQPEVSV